MSLSVNNLCFSYRDNCVLKSVSFTAERGEFLSVLGPNGVGKSTLFRCILGLLTPSHGSVCINGTKISTIRTKQLAKYIAYIPQSHNPTFNFTVFDMVLMGTTVELGQFASPGKTQKEQAQKVLEQLDIVHLKDRGYGSISGGERQLVLIARALAQQATILIMDEPSSSLDFGNKVKVMQTAKKLAHNGYIVIQSTHDPDQAYLYSDKILALYAGEVLAWGEPQNVICSSLISKLYGIEVEVCTMHIRNDSVRVCVPAKDIYCKKG